MYIDTEGNTLASQTVGASLNFSLTVVDASGAALVNTPVVLSVHVRQCAAANRRHRTPAATIHVQLHRHTVGGIDTVQATCTINGATGYSNAGRSPGTAEQIRLRW